MHILQSLIRPLVISVVVPIMVACAGIWLTDHYQEKAWHRQTSFELFKANYEKALETIDELSQVMGARFFGLMRVTWVAQGSETGNMDSVWDEYYESVQEWNMKKMYFKNRVARAVDDEMANLFADLKSDTQVLYHDRSPTSVHGHFLMAHKKVKQLVDCVHDGCSDDKKQVAWSRADEALSELGVAMSDFSENYSKRAYEQAKQYALH